MDQISHYQNVVTKLTVTPKYRNQNNIFTYVFLRKKNVCSMCCQHHVILLIFSKKKRHHVTLHYFQNNYKGKLQLTHLWFNRNLSYLLVV